MSAVQKHENRNSAAASLPDKDDVHATEVVVFQSREVWRLHSMECRQSKTHVLGQNTGKVLVWWTKFQNLFQQGFNL